MILLETQREPVPGRQPEHSIKKCDKLVAAKHQETATNDKGTTKKEFAKHTHNYYRSRNKFR